MSFWQTIDRPIIGLSPMDGVTDASFRFITAKHGRPDVTLTEFVNVESAFFTPHALIKDLTYCEIERPAVAQIYGHKPELFYQVAHVVCELGFDGLDINMGCPAKKVAARGAGAGLIRTPEVARAIIRAARRGIQDWFAGQTLSDVQMPPRLVEYVRTSNRLRCGLESAAERRLIPLSVKTRLGYDDVIVEEWIGNLLEEEPAAITLHGRTLKQGYKGCADWDAIARAAEVAKGSSTLILGNGDLQNMEEVYGRLRNTNLAGVLVGRATQGNPWIFGSKDQVKRALCEERNLAIQQAPIGLFERFAVMVEHASHFETFWGSVKFVGMRKHLAWYCRESRGAAQLRARLVRTHNVSEVVECLTNYASFLTPERGPGVYIANAGHPFQPALLSH